ncbi:MAG TPA: PC4/YdbC family ssDNA-binding protein [Bacillota bacterium]|nr:PC4/YdbC family ssDNA-binding protein [Bacillota bacterium]HPE39030.1 PC4/YdbC family ssDNA-binding protein [Bacillota bacterium]
MARTEIKSEIVKEIGILSTSKSNWNREVNIVRWNEGKPKLDIRDWAPDHEKVGKGISLSAEEVAVLKEILAEYDPYEVEE